MAPTLLFLLVGLVVGFLCGRLLPFREVPVRVPPTCVDAIDPMVEEKSHAAASLHWPAIGQREVAVCIQGQMRALETTWSSVRRLLIDVVGADVFLATDKAELTPEVLAHFDNTLVATYGAVPWTMAESRQKIEDAGGYWNGGLLEIEGAGFLQVQRRMQCMKIITEQEQKRGFKYKYVITTRSDLKYVLPHPPMALFEESSARNPFSIYSVSTKPYSKEARIFDKHFVLPREAADIFIGGLYNAYLDSSICSIMYLKAFEHIMITWIQIVGLDHFMIPSPFYLTCTPETRTLVSPCRHDAISTAYEYHKGSAPELWAMRHNMRVLHGFGVKIGDQGASPHRDDFDTKLMRFDEWDQTLWGQIRRAAPTLRTPPLSAYFAAIGTTQPRLIGLNMSGST